MNTKKLLLLDGIINAFLGLVLILFPSSFANWLGVPIPAENFYVNILGAVFIGIAIALFWESKRDPEINKQPGLGVVGAAAINLCGGAMLGYWLVASQLELNVAGLVFLWMLVIILFGISILELIKLHE